MESIRAPRANPKHRYKPVGRLALGHMLRDGGEELEEPGGIWQHCHGTLHEIHFDNLFGKPKHLSCSRIIYSLGL